MEWKRHPIPLLLPVVQIARARAEVILWGIGNFQVLLISIRLFAPVNKTIMQQFTFLVNTTDNTGNGCFFYSRLMKTAAC